MKIFSNLESRLKAYRWIVVSTLVIFFTLTLIGALAPILAVSSILLIVTTALLSPTQTVKDQDNNAIAPEDISAINPHVQSLLNGVLEPIVLLKSEGSVICANAAFKNTFGEIVERDSIMLRIRNPEIQRLIRQAADGLRPDPIEYNLTGQEERWFAASAMMIENNAQVMLHFRDLTDAKKTDRVRSDFIANASHELRTPLASLIGFIETLAGSARNDANARDRFLKIMLSQAERMSRLIDDLLTLSRFETGRGREDFKPLAVLDPITHVVDALRPMAKAKGTSINIQMSSTVADGSGSVLGSRDELIQLFENLVENAIKYGKDNGKVVVDINGDVDTAQLKVVVSDDGPGIPSQHIPRLVERFYRVDVDTSNGKQGTGLGLSIVRHIIQRHRGRLKIESNIDVGSSFIVIFPSLLTPKPTQ